MKVLRSVGWLAAVFVAGVLGIYAGAKVRDHAGAAPRASLRAEMVQPRLPIGEPFPDLPLTDLDGRIVSSRDLAAGGSVVLFLDLECPPCTDLARRWQTALDDGAVEAGQVWGVSYHPRERIEEYREAHGLDLPIYEDAGQRFRTDHRIDRFPLAVTVGASGLVRDTSYDSASPIDPEAVEARLMR
jgi:peroxiredoxin